MSITENSDFYILMLVECKILYQTLGREVIGRKEEQDIKMIPVDAQPSEGPRGGASMHMSQAGQQQAVHVG